MKHDLNGLSVNVGDSQIVPSVKVRNLGIIFDQSLTFDDHISAICQSVHFHIRSIGKVRKLLSFDACAILIHALISSRLDYCNSILYNLPDTKIGRLQKSAKSSCAYPDEIPSQKTHHTCIKTTTLAKGTGKNQIQDPDPDPDP